MTVETANIEYEVMKENVTSIHKDATQAMSIASKLLVAEDGSMSLEASGNFNKDQYKKAVMAFIDGKTLTKTLTFPLQMGKVTYIASYPAEESIYLLFRHDSVMATSYNEEGKEHSQFCQPPVYFAVSINTVNNEKSYVIIASRFAVRDRFFPHNNRSNSNIYSHCCAGSYSDQMRDALRQDDLRPFVAIFSNYLQNGTNANDEYGQSCRYFKKNYVAQNQSLSVTTTSEAAAIGYSLNDPETPFDFNMEEQQINLVFKNQHIQTEYLKHASIATGFKS